MLAAGDQKTWLGLRKLCLPQMFDIRRDPFHNSARVGQFRPAARIEIPIIQYLTTQQR